MEHPIARLLAHPWALLPALFEAASVAYRARLAGDAPVAVAQVVQHGTPAEVAVKTIGGAVAKADRPYQVVDGAAIIPVEGVMTKRPMMLNLCEETTGTATLLGWFNDAMDDPDITDVVLYVDSPGGSVDGTQNFADAIFAARGRKPITAYVDGLGASAAMWVAAMADRIVAASPTTILGSIGVVATHVDVSEQDKMKGIKVTEICAGEYKRAYSNHKPLDEKGESVLQTRVDNVYTEFITSVAAGRGTDPDDAHARWGGAREFLAREALDLGLIDAIQPFNQFMSTRRDSRGNTTMEVAMTHPDHSQVEATGGDQGVVAAADAVAQERQRIQGIFDATIPGHEALARKLAFEDNASVEDATAAMLAAEGARIKQESPAPTGGAAAPADPLRARWDASPSLRNLYGTFEEFQEAQSALSRAETEGRAATFLRKG